MPLILPGNVASALPTGFNVANSCRFNKADAPQLSRSTGDGNDRTGSFSFWWKTADPHDGCIFYTVYIDSSNFFNIGMDGGGNIEVTNKDSGSYNLQCETTASYRDHGAWYHVCAIVDTTQAVAANRMKLYINGIQVTSFQTETYPDQNTDLKMNPDSQTAYISHSGNRMHGYLAEFVVIDGTAQAVTDFGEFDEDSPTIWKPKDVSELTKGVNGFYLDFEDSSNLGNCAFGGTDLTEANLDATDQATDTPTNNFCTLNPIYRNDGGWTSQGAPGTFSQGNMYMGTAGHGGTMGTIGTTKMKFYFEINVDNNDNLCLGIIGTSPTGGVTYSYDDATAYGYYPYGTTGQKIVAGTWSSDSNFKDAGIYHFAVDPTANKMWIGKDGTWDGDPAAGSGNLFTPADYEFTPWIHAASAAQSNTFACNFGGCSAFTVSSGNADDDGYGNFEFDVPAGFYALCTKNLAEYG